MDLWTLDVVVYCVLRAVYQTVMSLVSIRVPDEIESGLAREAERSHRSKSEVVRDAIADYLKRQEREHFLARMEAAARVLATDAASRGEAVEIAEEFLPLENEALAVAEPRTEYKVSPRAPARKKRKR